MFRSVSLQAVGCWSQSLGAGIEWGRSSGPWWGMGRITCWARDGVRNIGVELFQRHGGQGDEASGHLNLVLDGSDVGPGPDCLAVHQEDSLVVWELHLHTQAFLLQTKEL